MSGSTSMCLLKMCLLCSPTGLASFPGFSVSFGSHAKFVWLPNKAGTPGNELTLYQPMTLRCAMRHGLSLHKAIGIYMGFLILGAILQYMVSASFSYFLIVGKGLRLYSRWDRLHSDNINSEIWATLCVLTCNGEFVIALCVHVTVDLSLHPGSYVYM